MRSSTTISGRLLAGHLEPGKSVVRDKHRESRLVQVIPEQIDNVGFVFNDENSVAPWRLRLIAEESEPWQAGKTALGADIAREKKIRATRVRCSEQRKLNRGGPNMLP